MIYMLYNGSEWKPGWALGQHTKMGTTVSVVCYLKRCEQAPAAAHFEETVFCDECLRQMFYFILFQLLHLF